MSTAVVRLPLLLLRASNTAPQAPKVSKPVSPRNLRPRGKRQKRPAICVEDKTIHHKVPEIVP
jgi:hypothetical protein